MQRIRPIAIVGAVPVAARAGVIAACALTTAACSGATIGAEPATRLAYGVPSPPNGLYHVEENLSVGVSTPVGDVEMATNTNLTMDMVFGRDPGGVGVIGVVVGFDATSANTLTGTRVADSDDVTGPLALVLGRRGRVEVGTMPALDSAVAELSPFPGVAFELFPLLPGPRVGQGGVWTETVTWSVVDGATRTTNTTDYTYTMIGDTLVAGLPPLKIGVEGDVRLESVQGQGERGSTQALTGTTTGYVLWDSEINMPAFVTSRRELEGSNTVPGAGSIRMTVSGEVRVTALFEREEGS